MSCRLLFIRHGQSIGNLNNVFLGHTDLDLSPLGYRQAEAVAEYLKTENVDVIYSSDLLRAFNTSVPFSKAVGLTQIKSKNLREIFAGDWENQKFDDIIKIYGKSYNIWLNDIGNAFPDNGESVKQLCERIYLEIKRIATENDGKTVAIFTHATPIRAFFTYINGGSAAEMINLNWPLNASLSEAVFENDTFKEVRYSFCEYLGDSKSVVSGLV